MTLYRTTCMNSSLIDAAHNTCFLYFSVDRSSLGRCQCVIYISVKLQRQLSYIRNVRLVSYIPQAVAYSRARCRYFDTMIQLRVIFPEYKKFLIMVLKYVDNTHAHTNRCMRKNVKNIWGYIFHWVYAQEDTCSITIKKRCSFIYVYVSLEV